MKTYTIYYSDCRMPEITNNEEFADILIIAAKQEHILISAEYVDNGKLYILNNDNTWERVTPAAVCYGVGHDYKYFKRIELAEQFARSILKEGGFAKMFVGHCEYFLD